MLGANHRWAGPAAATVPASGRQQPEPCPRLTRHPSSPCQGAAGQHFSRERAPAFPHIGPTGSSSGRAFQSTKAGGHTSRPGRTPRTPVRSPASRSHLEPLWFGVQSFSVLTRLHQLSKPLSTRKLPSFTFNHSSRWSQPAHVFPMSSSSSVPAERLVPGVLRTGARAQRGLGGVGWGGLRQWAGVPVCPVLSVCLPDDATHSRDEPGALRLPRHSCRGARGQAWVFTRVCPASREATLSVTSHCCGCGRPGVRFKVPLKLVVILSASEFSQVMSDRKSVV